jgi:hypothetical protein
MDETAQATSEGWRFEEQVTVARFGDLSSAWVALGMLEAHGIPAALTDQHTAGINWLCVPAIGGVRLQTGPQHAADAKRLLGQVRSTVLHDSNCAGYFAEARRRKRARGLLGLLMVSPWLAAVGVFGLLLGRGGENARTSAVESGTEAGGQRGWRRG